MTGYGTATADSTAGRFIVEMRSVNHRFSEVVVRTPRDLGTLEDRVRALVQSRVQRGRVEVIIARDGQSRRPRSVRADLDLASAYLGAARSLGESLAVPGEITLPMVAGFPEVIRLEETREDAEALWPTLHPAVQAALNGLVAMREEEGGRLRRDLEARLERIAVHLGEIRARSRAVVMEYGERLRRRLGEMLGEVPVDEGRLAVELALLAERGDISEELTRLDSHTAQFRAVLGSTEGAVGRTLEFLLQEMGREINTIGSKAGDLEISRAVIAVKGELESLREQVQNLE